MTSSTLDAAQAINSLEAQVKCHENSLQQLQTEKKTLEKTIRTKDQALLDLQDKLQRMDNPSHELSKLQNNIKSLENELERYKHENKTLLRIQKTKSNALEELSSKINEMEETPHDIITGLRDEVKNKDRQLQELTLEKRTLVRVQQRKDEEILRLQNTIESTDGPGSFKSMERENKSLKGEIERFRDQKEQFQRTIKSQEKRIRLLLKKLESIASTIKDMKGDIIQPLQAHTEVVMRANNLQENFEQNEELPVVPLELYELMENECNRYRVLCDQKDSEINEKEDEIENLSRKIDVLKKSQSSSVRKFKSDVQQYELDVEDLKRELEIRDDECNRREAVLKSEIYALRNDLARLQAVIAEQAESLKNLGH
ncbi:hypothetical protein GEMRC1_005993 [Eukaryota sp. GEM-RC1]